MSKILNNPRAFLESLSSTEFKEMLDKFGFEYEDISNCSEELKEILKQKDDKINELMDVIDSLKEELHSKERTSEGLSFSFDGELPTDEQMFEQMNQVYSEENKVEKADKLYNEIKEEK